MTEQAMSPSEAAGVIESLRTLYDFASRDDQALSALIDHARATAAHGDLAALAEQWEGQATDLLREMGRSSVSVEEATANPLVADALNEAAADLRAALAAHRCAPAVEVATPTEDDHTVRGALARLLSAADDLIAYVEDPGTEALGAVWMARQALGTAPAAPQASEAASGDALDLARRIRERVTSLDVRDQVDDLIAALRDASPAVEVATGNSSLSVKSSTACVPPHGFSHVDDSFDPDSDLDTAGVAYVLGNLADWATRNAVSGRGIDRDLVLADLERVRRFLVADQPGDPS